MFAGGRAASAVGIDRLQPGDHAFLAFADEEERWDILSVFTRQGFARDEKVFLSVDTTASVADVAIRVAGEAAAGALDSGQLVVSTSPRFGPGEFDARRMVDAIRGSVDAVVGEGYRGLRAASEMSSCYRSRDCELVTKLTSGRALG